MQNDNNHKLMAQARKKLGEYGEHLAAEYLQNNGYTIVETNWRCPHGEIDIIARDHQSIIFVEVKTRRASSTEAAFANITQHKKQRLIKLAYTYLASHQHEQAAWRIDVIAIAVSSTQLPIVEHVEDALGW